MLGPVLFLVVVLVFVFTFQNLVFHTFLNFEVFCFFFSIWALSIYILLFIIISPNGICIMPLMKVISE